MSRLTDKEWVDITRKTVENYNTGHLRLGQSYMNALGDINIDLYTNNKHIILFKIKSTGIKTYELSVFNRWGAKIFATNDSKTFWDGKDNSGKDSNSGTYYYVLKATSTSGAIFDKTGFVTLLR